MRILCQRQEGDRDHLVLLFGIGMLGKSIQSALEDFRYETLNAIGFDWHDAPSQIRVLSEVESYCAARSPTRLSVSWTAGGKGFSCGEEDARQETDSLVEILSMVRRLKAQAAASEFDFHFMSSAGGLFEGQRVVDASSRPKPMRPYGEMKLRQEHILSDFSSHMTIAIYRPSSVYGPKAQNARHGLINNLINDGLRGRPTVLDARVMSLRDYVFAPDIGKYVARCIRCPDRSHINPSVRFLVSSRCASIYEVVRTIERVTHTKLRFRYDEGFGNHSNITFSHSVLPTDWSPTALEVGVRQFLSGRHAHLPLTLSA